jgi:hypothetical protein
MNTDVLNTEETAIVPNADDKIIVSQDEFSEILWEKDQKLSKGFGIVDLWNIRRKARRYSIYGRRH